jgi:hypothetical protein
LQSTSTKAAGEPNRIQLVFTPLFSDYNALCNAIAKPWQAKLENFIVWGIVALNSIVGIFVLATSDFDRPLEYIPWNFIIAGLVLVLRYPVTRWFRQWNFRRLEIGKFETCIWLDEAKITSRNTVIEASFDWSAIKRASVTSTHAFLWMNAIQALMLPFYALKAGSSRDEMLNLIRRNVTQIENR